MGYNHVIIINEALFREKWPGVHPMEIGLEAMQGVLVAEVDHLGHSGFPADPTVDERIKLNKMIDNAEGAIAYSEARRLPAHYVEDKQAQIAAYKERLAVLDDLSEHYKDLPEYARYKLLEQVTAWVLATASTFDVHYYTDWEDD